MSLYIVPRRTLTRVVGRSGPVDYFCSGTNDQVPIQAAIDSATAAGGGVVLIRGGNYSISASITLKSNVTLEGEGIGATFITGTDSDFTIIQTTKTGTSKTVYDDIAVKDLSIVSLRGSCLTINNTTNVVVENIYLRFVATPLIRQALTFQHCDAAIAKNIGIRFLAGNGVSFNGCSNFVLDGLNGFGGPNSDDVVDVDSDFNDTNTVISEFGTLSNINVDTVGLGNGIRIEHAHNVTLTNFNVKNVTAANSAGLYVNTGGSFDMRDIAISSGTISDCTENGIAFDDGGRPSENIHAENVVIRNCGANGGAAARAGVRLGATGVTIDDITVDGTAKAGADGAGILLYKRNNARILNCRVRNSATGIRAWNGDGLQSYADVTVRGMEYSTNTANMANFSIVSGDVERRETAATTNATVTTVATIPVPASTTLGITGYVTARRTGGTGGTAEDGALYRVEAVYKNVSGAATQIGATVTAIGESQVAWDVTLTASGSTALIQVTGATNNNVTWMSEIRTTSV